MSEWEAGRRRRVGEQVGTGFVMGDEAEEQAERASGKATKQGLHLGPLCIRLHVHTMNRGIGQIDVVQPGTSCITLFHTENAWFTFD